MNSSFTSWKEAGLVFLWSRLMLVAVTGCCIVLLPLWIPGYRAWSSPDIFHLFPSEMVNQLLFSWLRWDTISYLNIASFGYRTASETAFFPLWPLTQHLGGLALGGTFPLSFYLAGLLLSNLFFYLALVLLYRLVARAFGPSIARRSLFYFTFSPFALFFFAGYTESLFVLLCLGMFLALQRGKPGDWWLAGGCGMLAASCRTVGILLVIPFLVVVVRQFWWRQPCSWKARVQALVPITLIPMGTLLYLGYLFLTWGDPLIFKAQEELVWHRHLTFPLWTLVLAFEAIFQAPLVIVQIENIMNFCVVLLFLIALLRGWNVLPLHFSLFALVMAAFPLSFPTIIPEIVPLLSQPRYLMILFPVTILFAIWGKDPRVDRGLRVTMVLLLTLTTAMFVSNVWVA